MDFCAKLLYPELSDRVDITESAIISIRHLMCTPEYMMHIERPPITLPEPEKPQERKRFSPRRENTLFWCMFYSHYGEKDYEFVGSRYLNAELDEKQRMTDSLLKTPEKLKASSEKLSKQAIQTLASAILVDRRDSFDTIIAYAVYYNVNVYILFSNRTYLEYLPSPLSEKSVYLHAKQMGKKTGWVFSLDTLPPPEMENTYLRLESWEKPLRSASAYKVDDLVRMAEKVGMELSAKTKKQDLYDKLGEFCSGIILSG